MTTTKNLLLLLLSFVALSCVDKKTSKKEDGISTKQYDSLIALGTQYFQNNRLKEAINSFKMAVRSDSSKIIGIYRLGVAQASLCNQDNISECDESLKNLYKVVSKNDDYEKVNYNLGIIYFKIGDYKNSIRYFDKAITDDPTDSDYYVNRALAKLNINDSIGSCTDLNKAKNLGDSSALNLLNQYCR